MNINDKIKKAIKRQGFTLSSVASKMRNERSGEMGISQPSLSDMLKGNIPFNRVEEIASIIGLTISDIIQEDESIRIVCPNCGQEFKIVPVEKEEIIDEREVEIRSGDGTYYRYRNPRNKAERMAIFELQSEPDEDGLVSVRNINLIDSDASEIEDVPLSRLVSF